jgi:CMP-N,N'-diacetyllegionaminic acid synthase
VVMNENETLCVIPARGGSKGLPGKNIRPILGKPLIAWTIEAALESPVIDTVLVTTDCEEIAKIAKEFGAEVPFLRPEALAEDLTTTEATLQHALLTYEEMTGREVDICVFMTATCVFRDPEWIVDAVSLLKTRPELESVFTGSVTSKNYWQRDSDGKPERVLPWMREYSSRQIRNVIYREDTPIVSASRASLWREGRRIGDNVEIIEVKDSATDIDIHEEFDFFLAEQALRYRLNSK